MLEIKKSQTMMPRDFLNFNVRAIETSLSEDVKRATEALNKIREYREEGRFDIVIEEVFGDISSQLESLRYDLNIARRHDM